MDDLDFEDDCTMLHRDTQLSLSDLICNSRDIDNEELDGMYVS